MWEHAISERDIGLCDAASPTVELDVPALDSAGDDVGDDVGDVVSPPSLSAERGLPGCSSNKRIFEAGFRRETSPSSYSMRYVPSPLSAWKRSVANGLTDS